MASIFERLNKNGTTTTRVQIRRKGLPKLILSFSSYDEAKKWVKEHERQYIKNPDHYQSWIEKERLNMQREREFNR